MYLGLVSSFEENIVHPLVLKISVFQPANLYFIKKNKYIQSFLIFVDSLKAKFCVKLCIWQASIFHFGSISLIAETCRSAHVTAMQEAKKAGVLLSYDPNLRLALWPSAEEAKNQMMSVLDQADIVKISDTELEFFTGKSSVEDEIAMSMWRPTMKLLVVTLGRNGCKYYTEVCTWACLSI